MTDVESRLQTALSFAAERHGDQKYGEQPYRVHVNAVVQFVREFNLSENELVAAALHDILEDTATTVEELSELFGHEAATLVRCVTGEGENREARQRSIIEKLTKNPRAINLKLADRIANVEAARAGGKTRLLQMYRNEIPLYEPVFRLGNPAMYRRLLNAFA